MIDPGENTSVPGIEAPFEPVEGGVNPVLERLHLAHGARLRRVRVAVLLAGVTWLPLLILTAVEGVAWGDGVQVPFVKDFLPYGQLLVAVPALVLGELMIGRLVMGAADELRTSGVLDSKDMHVLDTVLWRALRRWRGQTINLVLLVVTCSATALSLWGAREWLTGGWQVAGERMAPAGWWYLLVSLPVLRFLELKWLWRLLLWAWVLWRVSRLELHPRPAHPDRAGGLAFLGDTQTAFGVLVFALGIQLSCLIADAISFRGSDLTAFRGHVLAFIVIVLVVLLLSLIHI